MIRDGIREIPQEPSIVGFSGTRRGMTRAQVEKVYSILDELPPGVGHHGDCVGADVDFHGIVRRLYASWSLVGHPPTNPALRAYCECDAWWPAKEYLVRNQDIVDACRTFVATPRTFRPEKGGTWSTIRRAWTAGKEGTVVWPDGSTATLSAALGRTGRNRADANSIPDPKSEDMG